MALNLFADPVSPITEGRDFQVKVSGGDATVEVEDSSIGRKSVFFIGRLCTSQHGVSAGKDRKNRIGSQLPDRGHPEAGLETASSSRGNED